MIDSESIASEKTSANSLTWRTAGEISPQVATPTFEAMSTPIPNPPPPDATVALRPSTPQHQVVMPPASSRPVAPFGA